MKAIIVYGPQGCGKTINAMAIARHLGVDHGKIIDGWAPCTPLPEGALALTNAPVEGALHFDDIMRQIQAAQS